MANKRFWWGIGCVWIFMMATDWAFHGVWLQGWYQQTAQMWRPMGEMQKMMWWMWFGRLVFAWAFVWIFSKGISKDNPWHQAFRYGWAILTVSQLPALMGQWATMPLPFELWVRWLLIDTVQAIGCAFVLTWVFKPEMKWAK